MGRRLALDVFDTIGSPRATVLYMHGFGGFKDWGDNDYLAQRWVAAGVRYIRFNFSLNGTTPEYPTEFVDLDGFAANNYTHMLYDVGQVLSFIGKHETMRKAAEVNEVPIILVGHSMGGTVALLAAAEYPTVAAAISWAAPAACKTPWERWPAWQLKTWRELGVQYYLNSRTRQQLPIAYQLYQDFEANAARFDLQKRLADCKKPLLMMYGLADTSVPASAAQLLAGYASNARLWLGDGDHTFNRRHPSAAFGTTPAMAAVLAASLEFIDSITS